MEQWKIQRDRKSVMRCGKCDQPFGTNAHVAILHLPACLRQDLCEPCFGDVQRQASEQPFHWRVPRKVSGRREPVLDLNGLRQLFDRLDPATADASGIEGGEDPAVVLQRMAGLRYLVALLLLRKRVLKMADARNASEEAADLLVVDPKVEGMEPVALFAPDLGGQGLDELRTELLAMAGLTGGDEGGSEAEAS